MIKLKRHTPANVADCLPDECALKRALEEKFRDIFIKYGYREVETPTYEYFDVFSSGVNSYPQEQLIKFFDERGAILALRPDMTVPIARLCATKMDGGLKKLYYVGNVFLKDTGEDTQAGAELIGMCGLQADVEMAAMAIEVLKASGLPSFKLEIGDVGLFNNLTRNISEEMTEKLRQAIDSKNYAELSALLELNELKDAREGFLNLLTLFGGEEVFNRAPKDVSVDRLKSVYLALKELGYGEYLTVDFGNLTDLGYYTGLTLRGLTEGVGEPVLSGGRYDTLFKDFGAPDCAVGFALYEKRILIALERRGALCFAPDRCLTMSFDKSSLKTAYALACEIRKTRPLRFVEGDADIIIKNNKVRKGEELC